MENSLRKQKQIEEIRDGEIILAFFCHSSYQPEKTTFITPVELEQQVGYIVCAAGGEIAPHQHNRVERKLTSTSEALIVQQGRCLVDFYNEDQALVSTKEAGSGDLILMIAGGHGIRMLEETTLLEIKQGPYLGEAERSDF